ncbi:MAG: hypothetical protein IK954_05210 [Clostridia bacterium]|nr:hypothetical protein [Clostridia bacterium]
MTATPHGSTSATAAVSSSVAHSSNTITSGANNRSARRIPSGLGQPRMTSQSPKTSPKLNSPRSSTTATRQRRPSAPSDRRLAISRNSVVLPLDGCPHNSIEDGVPSAVSNRHSGAERSECRRLMRKQSEVTECTESGLPSLTVTVPPTPTRKPVSVVT